MERKPTHPGAILREHYMEPLGLSVTAVAEALDISRKHTSSLANESVRVTPDLAIRLAKAFDTSVEFWLNLQRECDLYEAYRSGDFSRVRVIKNKGGV